jgi:hypothetical protein
MVRDRWPLRVKNSSGSVIPPFSVVLITTVAASNNELVYTVRQPNAASTDFNWNGYLVTGPFAIGAGASDEGLATDLAQPNYVRYDTGTPAIKEVWGPKHAQFTLSKNYYGFEVLGGNTTAGGNNVTIAKWIGVDKALGKPDATIAKDASGTVSVYFSTAGSESDTTMNIASVYNRGNDLTTSDYVFVMLNGGVPYCVTGVSNPIEFHRGVTDAAIAKGASGTVSRYTDGTTSDSGINDTVSNDFANVAITKKVAYIKSGGNFYMIAAECA